MNSEQLKFQLGLPWDGVDPRYLTKGFARRSFVREGTGRLILEAIGAMDPIQLELFPEGTPYGS